MHGFTMALAQETAAKGVTVNTVSPGYIGTEMVMAIPEKVRESIIATIPVGRLGERLHDRRQPVDQRRFAHALSRLTHGLASEGRSPRERLRPFFLTIGMTADDISNRSFMTFLIRDNRLRSQTDGHASPAKPY
jgi:hypothetical protein